MRNIQIENGQIKKMILASSQSFYIFFFLTKNKHYVSIVQSNEELIYLFIYFFKKTQSEIYHQIA